MSSFVTQEMVNAFLEVAQPKWRESLSWFRHEKRTVAGLSALSAMPFASRLALARALVPGWAVEQDWQPIATAPTNGTWIWCWHAEHRWKRIGMRSKASGPRWYYSRTGFNAQYADDAPTHWRPLPADPAAEEPPHGP